jgi:hypothetical protein
MHQATVPNQIDFSSAPLPASNGEFAHWTSEELYAGITTLKAVQARFMFDNYQTALICLEIAHIDKSNIGTNLCSVIAARLGEDCPGVRSYLSYNWKEGNSQVQAAGADDFICLPNTVFLSYRIKWLDSMIEEMSKELAV